MWKLQTNIRDTGNCKILEKLISDQLIVYFNDNNFIANQQSGFQICHSTETALMQITEQYLLNIHKGIINRTARYATEACLVLTKCMLGSKFENFISSMNLNCKY